ncbi:MAG: hypothetical protein KDC44_11740, partial [Phaeodactylibacter sp.]|nr:hypothetical protein [Phaeodactylibacter sp.]
NYDADRIATLSWSIPTLVFAGRADTVTTLEHSNTFAESADQCSVIAFDGEHLRGAMSLGMPAYMAAIVDLLKE